MANIPQLCSMSSLDSCWLSLQMPLEQEINNDTKQMANQSQRGTWWCGVWTHVCWHCSLWWSPLQWHANPISWQSTSYHCIILLIDWDCATKGLARPLWVSAYDLRYHWITKCSEIPPDTMNPLKLMQQLHLHLLLSKPKNLRSSMCAILQIAIQELNC
jgi:hypothetical protein